MYQQNMKRMNETVNQLYSATNAQELITFPENIVLGVTQRCNFGCIMCKVWREKNPVELSPEVMAKLEPVLPFVRSMHITGGEPLIWGGLGDLLAKNTKAEVDTSIVTNASVLNQSKIDMFMDNRVVRLKVSLDAATPGTYEAIHGFKFLTVLRNITRLSAEKARRRSPFPVIQLGFVAMKRNIRELAKYVAIAGELGAQSVRVAHCFLHTPEVQGEGLADVPELSDHEMHKAALVAEKLGIELSLPPLFDKKAFAKEAGGQGKFVSREITTCREPWTGLWINHDGMGKLCCHGGGGAYGNINEMDFMEFWNHPRRREVRRLLNTGTVPLECKGCFHFAHKGKQDVEAIEDVETGEGMPVAEEKRPEQQPAQ